MPNDFLKPAKIDRRGPLYTVGSVREFLAAEANVGRPITRRSRNVATDYENAADVMASAKEMFNTELAALNEAQAALSAAAKNTSSNVRKAANEIHEGIQRVEKAANFDRLERQVAILERAAAALTVLADLEKGGKLERLIAAVK